MRVEEITLRINNEDVEDYLKRNGFFPVDDYSFEDLEGNKRIDLKLEGVYCYSVDRGSVYDSPLLEMYIPFLPETPILDYLLNKIHFIQK